MIDATKVVKECNSNAILCFLFAAVRVVFQRFCWSCPFVCCVFLGLFCYISFVLMSLSFNPTLLTFVITFPCFLEFMLLCLASLSLSLV